jgi:hypothetical protein
MIKMEPNPDLQQQNPKRKRKKDEAYYYYRRTPEWHQIVKDKANKKYKEFRAKWYLNLKCVYCNTDKMIRWRHRPNTIINFEVKDMRGLPDNAIKKEISKCYPICSGCNLKLSRGLLKEKKFDNLGRIVEEKEPLTNDGVSSNNS